MTLWQNDKRWGSLRLGDGQSTIGHAGCLLTLLCEAASRQAGRTGITPPHANEALRKAGAFSGSNLIVELAARALGMESPAEEKVKGLPGDDKLQIALSGALSRGMAIVHVDHDGDGVGNHFILAISMSAMGAKHMYVECTDSALAKTVRLSWPGLSAQVEWAGVPKTYRAVSVRPLRPLPH